MKKVMNMDDVMEGMWVTVFTGQKTTVRTMTPVGPQTVTKEKSTYKGAVLEVLSVDMPYVVINHYSKYGGGRVQSDTLDLREVRLMKISDEYVRALLPDLKFKSFDTSLIDEGTTIEEIFKDL